MKPTPQNYIALENALREVAKTLIKEQMFYLKAVVKKHGNFINFSDTRYNDVHVTIINEQGNWQVGNVRAIYLNNNVPYIETDVDSSYRISSHYDLTSREWIDLCDAVRAIDVETCDESED